MIILPLLVIMLFAIIEFGIVYNRVQALHAAARREPGSHRSGNRPAAR